MEVHNKINVQSIISKKVPRFEYIRTQKLRSGIWISRVAVKLF